MAIIRAERLSKTYRVADKQPGLAGTLRHFVQRRHRDVAAVQGVSFSIEAGEMVGFLGPNGAGKTTTLKMLSGLIHPSGGSAEVEGHIPQRRQADFLRQITLVMGQKQQLIWDLPPLDSLRVNAAVYGLDDATARRRINELAEMLELGEELTRPVRKLSLGQRMKAELLAALLHQPAVLFLDEPTLGLDINAQARVRSFLADYNRRHGMVWSGEPSTPVHHRPSTPGRQLPTQPRLALPPHRLQRVVPERADLAQRAQSSRRRRVSSNFSNTGGSGASNSIRSPLIGWSSPRAAAWRACPVSFIGRWRQWL